MSQTLTAPPSPSTPATAPPSPPAPERTLKGEFFRFTERFGHMLSRLLLTLLYVVLVAPAGVFIALLGDPLRIKRYRGTSWNDWPHENETPEQARRQD